MVELGMYVVLGWLAAEADTPSAKPAAASAVLKHVDVFHAGQDGYFAYRIPAIEAAADGSLLAFAEARKHNLNDPGFGKQDIDLVLKRSEDGGVTWSAMKVIEDPGELWSAANPATVLDRTNKRLWVFYLRCRPERNTHTARPGTDDVLLLARWSDDHGRTWSDLMDLTSVARDMKDPHWRITVPGPGGAIQDRQGRLLVPCWKYEGWQNFAIYSDDHGRTWRRSEFVPGGKEGDENQLVELSDGNLMMDIRQSKGPHRWRTVSRDRGQTWSQPQPGHQVTPVACAIERLPHSASGREQDLLIWTGPKGPGRHTLILQLSSDDGKTFGQERILAAEPAAYSDLTVLPDGSVGVLWERDNYKKITFTRLQREMIANLASGDKQQ